MKKVLIKRLVVVATLLAVFSACERNDYESGTTSPYIANLDLRKIYRGSEVTLTQQNMRGAQFLKGQVVSDHTGGNLPAGVVFIQNARKVSETADSLRGIAINIGSAANSYIPGDSIHVKIEGGTLKRVDGLLQITGLSNANVEKKASGVTLRTAKLSALALKQNAEIFESCLSVVYNCNFEPNIGVETLEGAKTFDDATAQMQMNVSSNATFKGELLPWSAEITGIVIPANNTPQIRPRIQSDFKATSIVVDPAVPLGPTPVVITGFMADALGGDGNYEYVQMVATQDLDFRQKPFSVIVCRNSGGLTPYPGAAPIEGWIAGGNRSYKFNLTRGTVAKGTYFYVGGNKVINGSGSTSISNANWIVSKLYANEDGDDGVGLKTSGIMPNSGNPVGIGVFNTINVEVGTAPVDVVFYGSTSSATSTAHVYTPASGGNPAYGYLIANNDHYKKSAGLFYRQGTNTPYFVHNAPNVQPQGTFNKLGGEYKVSTNTWIKKRAVTYLSLVGSSKLPEIETGNGIFVLTP